MSRIPRSRLFTLIAARLVVGTVLLGTAVLIQVSRPGAFPVDPFFALAAMMYGLSLVYVAALRPVERWPWILDVQFVLDAVLVTAFIHLTGGVASYFSSLYALPIIAASTICLRHGALRVAAASALFYVVLIGSQYGAWLPVASPVAGGLPDARFALFTVGINVFGFFAVALLSGSLADGLRTAGARLAVASHQIRDLRAFNAHVVDCLPSGLATADASGRVLTFNRAAAAITGVDAPDALGRFAADVLQLPADARARLFAMESGHRLRVDLDYARPGGRRIDLGVTGATVMFPDGQPGWLFTFQDVTDLKRLERDGRLQQRLAALGEMAAGIAHEIRNPLASISGSIQVLRGELSLTDDQGQLMDIVLRESERLNDTIRSFLAYARPQKFGVAHLDLRTVLADTAALLRNSPEVRPEHAVAVDVPDEPVWYEADEHQIRQVVWNLATNGMRAMPTGGTLRLSVTDPDGAHDEHGDVVVSVRDEGCGIAAADIEGIFQPYRGTFDRGTGLGLAIVHRIVSDYGGRIAVESEAGRGTTMRVHLPASAGAPHENLASAPGSVIREHA